MKRGAIDIDNTYTLEYRYFDKDPSYKYFNRRFEIYLLEKKSLKKNYVLHIDNCDTSPGRWSPHVHKTPDVDKKYYFGVSTLNWNDIKNNFIDCIIGEIGEVSREKVKKAVGKLSSPKL
jgi:hypothetical protein